MKMPNTLSKPAAAKPQAKRSQGRGRGAKVLTPPTTETQAKDMEAASPISGRGEDSEHAIFASFGDPPAAARAAPMSPPTVAIGGRHADTTDVEASTGGPKRLDADDRPLSKAAASSVAPKTHEGDSPGDEDRPCKDLGSLISDPESMSIESETDSDDPEGVSEPESDDSEAPTPPRRAVRAKRKSHDSATSIRASLKSKAVRDARSGEVRRKRSRMEDMHDMLKLFQQFSQQNKAEQAPLEWARPTEPGSALPAGLPSLCAKTRGAAPKHLVMRSSNGMVGGFGPFPVGEYCGYCLHPLDRHEEGDVPGTEGTWEAVRKVLKIGPDGRVPDTLPFILEKAEVPSNVQTIPKDVLEGLMVMASLTQEEMKRLLPAALAAPRGDRIIESFGEAVPGLHVERCLAMGRMATLCAAAGDLGQQIFAQGQAVHLWNSGREALWKVLTEYAERSASYSMGLVNPRTMGVNRKWVYDLIKRTLEEEVRNYQPLEWATPKETIGEVLRRKLQVGTMEDPNIRLRTWVTQAGFWATLATRKGVAAALFRAWKKGLFASLDAFYKDQIAGGGNKILMTQVRVAATGAGAVAETGGRAGVRDGTQEPPTKIRRNGRGGRGPGGGRGAPPGSGAKAAADAAAKKNAESAKKQELAEAAKKLTAGDVCFVLECNQKRDAKSFWCTEHIASADDKATKWKPGAGFAVVAASKKLKAGRHH